MTPTHAATQFTTVWLRTRPANPAARLRLFCFPYAGGAASVFRTWQQYLPTDVEVCAVQLPGRENRIRERPFTDVATLVQALIPNLLPYLDRPFALFGHSMGSLIAYELAYTLHYEHQRTSEMLFVSGRRAPFLPDHEPPLHQLASPLALLNELQRRYQNLPAMLFEDAELQELFVPLLRADFTLVECYQPGVRTPLPCPVTAFGGDADSRASLAELCAWQQMTRGPFAVQIFPGGHFYLNQQTPALLAKIVEYLMLRLQ